jgi:hypothetical protein
MTAQNIVVMARTNPGTVLYAIRAMKITRAPMETMVPNTGNLADNEKKRYES